MDITVKNFRGCEAAELTLAPIALVCGHNEAGKTSIAQAVAAALTRNAAPLEGIAKKDARQLLRDGASRGSCRVGDQSGHAQANWPGASVSDDGNAPRASEIATGLVSIVDMKPAERAALLIQVMDALPDYDQLMGALDDHMAIAVIDAVWKAIQSDGWDAAYKRARNKGAELKGAWEQITGEKWGAVKGDSWRPAIFGDGPVDASPILDEQLADARAHLEECIRNRAADGERRRMLQELIDAGTADRTPYELAAEEADSAVAQADQVIESLPRPQRGSSGDCACPHCGEALVVNSRTDVRRPEPGLSDEENAARDQAITDAQAQRSAAVEKLRQASEAMRLIGQKQQEIERAQQELNAMSAGTVTPEQEQAARDAVQAAEQRINAARALHAATERHRGILQNQKLAEVLAPDGLRQQVLAEKMAAFNRTLAHLSAEGGWPAVKVHDDLSVTYGGRAFVLLSASAQWRVRLTLQLAIAGMDGSDAVVIDAADILDRRGRNGLFQAVASTKLRALILMTMDEAKNVPPLDKAGLGRSYWIEGGKLAPAGA